MSVGVAGAEVRPPGPGSGRWLGLLGVLAGALGFAAGLTSVYTGMRDVIVKQGGNCASGGPYVIANQCSAGETRQLFVGIAVMLVGGAIYLGVSSWIDAPVLAPGLLLWGALFGALGWNFIDLRSGAGGSGRLLSGIVFLLMAAGGLVPVLVIAAGWLRRGGAPRAPAPAQFPTGPIVRARAARPTAPDASSTDARAAIVPRRIVLPPRDLP